MRALLLSAIFCMVFSIGQAQDILTAKKTLAAVRTGIPIKIDGTLDEASWQLATPASDFTQFQFQWNVPSAFR